MKKIVQFPHSSQDMRAVMLDGKPETVLSARGVLLLYLSAWKKDRNQIARTGLRRYCEYLAIHGYGRRAGEILDELDEMDYPAAYAWVKSTYARYVQNPLALAQYVVQR